MDREIDTGTRRRKLLRRILMVAIPAVVGVAILIRGPELMRPSIGREMVRTARVERGPLEAAIAATGLVAPEVEQVISSPVNARVLKILLRPGAAVTAGDSILQLDLSESVLAFEKLNQQIELKQNQQSRARLDLENTLINLDSQWEIKNLEYKAARAATARNQELFRQGLLSDERLSELRLAEEKTRYELKQLEESKQKASQLTKTQLEGLALEMKTLDRERAEARRQLELGTTRAGRSGVLTWVVSEEGSTISKGEVLARIADLSTFRIEATVSDVHAGRIAVGLPATVRINDATLNGTVSRINPAVRDGAITLYIALAEPSSPLLRSNLRVDVSISTERRNDVLKIRKGPFASGEGMREVFVIRGDSAIKTQVRFGINGAEHYEVVDGLLEGDEVIISDMSNYIHAREVRIK